MWKGNENNTEFLKTVNLHLYMVGYVHFDSIDDGSNDDNNDGGDNDNNDNNKDNSNSNNNVV